MTRRFSLRNRISLVVGLMGLFALLLALVTAEVFERTALHSHQQHLHHVIDRETGDLLETLRADVADLAYALQSETEFRVALGSNNPNSIRTLLDKQFQRYFATEGVISLQRIAIYDANFDLLGTSSDTLHRIGEHIACATLTSRARERSGIEKSRTVHEICVSRGRAYFSLIASIGGLRPVGYIQLETDPVAALAMLETDLDAPVRVYAPNGRLKFQSLHWPAETRDTQTVIAEHAVHADNNDLAMRVLVASDVRELHQQLGTTLYLLLGIAAIATIAATLLTRSLLERSIVRPLEDLSAHLQKIQDDKSLLGKPLPASGDREVQRLAGAFNLMATELHNLYGTLQYMAFTDPLTHLPNRLQLQENLNQLIEIFRVKKLPFALFIIDLDRFKQVNDTLGHLAGDELLQSVAGRLRDALRTTDFIAPVSADEKPQDLQNIARLGGDEFAALLPLVATKQQAEQIADKAFSAMRRPFLVEGHQIKVDMSIGIALFPLHGTDAASLLRCADRAMYEAKRHGRGYAHFEPTHDYHLAHQFDLEHDLRHALSRGQLSLHYQPQVEMKTRRVRCAEALMRWHHHEEDMIPPDAFIPLAEQINLIRPLTFWALEQALRDCARWRAHGHDFGVAVNISPVCLHDPAFVPKTLELLNDHAVAPGVLTLEVTERGHHGQLQATIPALSALHSAGVRISVDDFGAGFPTLAQLKQLPLQQLKVDKTFILDMLHNPSDMAVVRAAIDIARQRGLEVVAEGVELPTQWDALVEAGMDTAQGYGIARPLAYSDLLNWLAATTTDAAIWIPQTATS